MLGRRRKSWGFPAKQTYLVISDRFKAQCTETVLEALEENHILVVLVPANCTDRLQPFDVSVKEFLRGQFHHWYASEVSKQLQSKEGTGVELVDLSLVHVKPLAATWLIKLMDYLKQHPEIAKNRFRKSGLL